jgi:cleavage and polyadenylation specificity factor subunit 2
LVSTWITVINPTRNFPICGLQKFNRERLKTHQSRVGTFSAAMLELTPLSALPHNCLLLTLDTVNILLNAATADGLAPPNLPAQLDFVLLSHSTPTHINALPRILLTHPYTQTYSTVPIATLGRLSALELTPPGPTVTAVKQDDDAFEFLTPKDVDRAFDKITTLRYSQPTILSHGITITAYPAGHSIGGTIWNIRKDQESIVVMLDWNHAKERTVGGMDPNMLRLLTRASCVITDVRGCSTPQVPTRKIREQFLIGRGSVELMRELTLRLNYHCIDIAAKCNDPSITSHKIS